MARKRYKPEEIVSLPQATRRPYLHEIADDLTARRLIRDWVAFYNAERPHAALGGQTPAEAWGAVSGSSSRPPGP